MVKKNREEFCVRGSDHCVLVSDGSGVMEVHHHARASVFLVAVDCGELTLLDLKDKGLLVFQS